MPTLISTAVASGHSYRGLGGQLAYSVCQAFHPRWAALGCDATSRQQFQNAKSAGLAKAPRLQSRQLRKSFRVIQAPRQQGFSFGSHSLSNTPQASTAFRVRLPVVFDGSANQNQHSAEVGIGRFHVVSSYPAATPRLEAFA
jgi:hypothetical protein